MTTQSFRNALAFQAEASLYFNFFTRDVIGNSVKTVKFAAQQERWFHEGHSQPTYEIVRLTWSRVSDNVPQACAVRDLEALHCLPAQI